MFNEFLENFKTVSPKVAQSRQNICNSCEHRRKFVNQCSICGCFLTAKTKMLYAECPLKKWNSPMTSWGVE